VRVSEAFPLTVTGKIAKVEMRHVSIDVFALQGAAAIPTAES
jgi:hypothetical protein